MRVAVAGGGIGGLVLALALREHGIEAEVYEQAEELREIGAAVALSANGVRELERLGLGDALAAVSTVPSALSLRRGEDGTLVARHPVAEDDSYRRAFGASYYGVHRVALLDALADALGDEHLHLGCSCEGATPDGELLLAGGERVRADVVVGADGVHSAVRRSLRLGERARFSGTVGYRGLVPTAELRSLPDPGGIQFWAGPGAHVLHYAIDGGAVVNFLAVVRTASWTSQTWMEPCSVADSLEAFEGWHPAVVEMLGAVSESARWALHDHVPLARWHDGRAVLIGDAAHAMLPHQGQGANQTIEDAAALAAILARAGGEIDAALARYTSLRRGRVRHVQRWSRRFADLLHAPGGLAGDAYSDLYRDLAWIHGHDAAALNDPTGSNHHVTVR